MDHQCRVVDTAAMAQRGTDEQDWRETGRVFQDRGDGLFHAVEQRVLQQQVLDGIAGQGQFRQHRQRHAARVTIPRHGEHGLCVRRGVGERGPDRAGGDAGEAVGVEGVEIHDRHCGPQRSFWSRASRNPSPSRLNASTVMKMARPGNTVKWSATPR